MRMNFYTGRIGTLKKQIRIYFENINKFIPIHKLKDVITLLYCRKQSIVDLENEYQ